MSVQAYISSIKLNLSCELLFYASKVVFGNFLSAFLESETQISKKKFKN